MSMTDISQRNLYDRVELSVPSTGVEVKRKGRLRILTVILVAILAVLGYAMVQGIDGWAHIAVIGGIVCTAVGTMLAVSPNRG